MKYFIYLINTFLLVLIPVSIITTDPKGEFSSVTSGLKKLKSEYVMRTDIPVEEAVVNVEEKTVDKEKDEVIEEEKQENIKPAIPIENKHADLNIDDIPKDKPTVVESPTNNGLEIYTGTMSGYGPDCLGCSGLVAYKGIDVRNNIYYNDDTYGRVRIVAGDKSIPFGTILKVETSKMPVQNVIVLDRGGDIGFNGVFLFDLLFDSQANARKFGISKNTKFTVLRKGF